MKKVLMVLLIVVVGFCGFVATRPATFHVERVTTIAVPSEAVFARINDLHQWDAWSPWEKLDPQMKKTYEGADAGVGASYHWSGNDKVGEGRMTITESEPGSKVGIKLEFIKPWQATNTGTFTFTPEAAGTRVTWAMDGTNNFMAKAMTIFMNMDQMIGSDFEKGLASLKELSEVAAAMPADSTTTAATQSAP